MASFALLPDKFDTGDFPAWLRNFECCATANKWSAEDKLIKLPAFLRGPAAAHFHSLGDEQRQSYAALTQHLKDALCPRVDREKFYSTFDHRKLRPDEDPSLLLWDLEDLLSKADPDLSAAARTALLERQFIKSLPPALRLRLLEYNPTPSLSDMRAFIQRYHAVHHLRDDSAVMATVDAPAPALRDELQASIRSLTAAVAALSTEQQQLKAALAEPPPQHRRGWKPQSRSSNARCFNCNQRGHFARECPWDAHCSVCRGWGHSQNQCPSRRSTPSSHAPSNAVGHHAPAQDDFRPFTPSVSAHNNSLNFKGVPQ